MSITDHLHGRRLFSRHRGAAREPPVFATYFLYHRGASEATLVATSEEISTRIPHLRQAATATTRPLQVSSVTTSPTPTASIQC